MNKNNFILLLSVVYLIFNFTSCKENKELLNSEADIISIDLPKNILKRNPVVDNTSVTCYAKEDVDITKLSPMFELSLGASIIPENGTVHDFTKPVEYTVTSENGEWKKKYVVSFISDKKKNDKAEIIKIELPDGILKRTPEFSNDSIKCYVNVNVDVTKLSPNFQISEGASLVPDNNSVHDFTNAVTYTVTSENGKIVRKYIVDFIKEKDLSKEANVIQINLPDGILVKNPVIEEDKITCYVGSYVDITKLAPEFNISEGATISPASATEQDFSLPKVYKVTSEDGKVIKDYTVSFEREKIVKYFNFDNFRLGENKYHEIYELENGKEDVVWASGNPGFSLLASGKPATDYPTFMSDTGFDNNCAELITRSTGTWGSWFGSPMAAGNLYLGTFKLNISNSLKSTRMGIPAKHNPIRMKGYYKYKSGDKFIQNTDEEGNKLSVGKELDRKDSCAIYAVFYEVTGDVQYLDGTNILTHENIVSIAQMENKNEQKDWTAFDIPFVLKDGKKIDLQKLKNGDYNIAIVFSSSKEGDLYNGAVGSTLLVDKVELISE